MKGRGHVNNCHSFKTGDRSVKGIPMLGWIRRKCLDGLFNRAFQRISIEGGRNEISVAFMSVALTYPCYPDTAYSARSCNRTRDTMLRMQLLGTNPAAYDEARSISSLWLDQQQISTDAAFESMWGMTWSSFFAKMVVSDIVHGINNTSQD